MWEKPFTILQQWYCSMYFKDLVKRKTFLGIFPSVFKIVSNKMTDTLYSVMKSMIVSECFCVWHVCKVLPAKKLTHKKLINLCAPLSEVHLIITTCVEETYTLLLLLLQIQTIILKVWQVLHQVFCLKNLSCLFARAKQTLACHHLSLFLSM